MRKYLSCSEQSEEADKGESECMSRLFLRHTDVLFVLCEFLLISQKVQYATKTYNHTLN